MERRNPRIVRLFERKANAGNVQAQFELGLRYATGQGVPQDYVAAHKWFNLAAAQGNSEARDHRAELALAMTTADIAAAQRLAREWMTVHR